MFLDNSIAKKLLPKPDFESQSIFYHYTTPYGLEGMVKNKTIWLSQIYYLNDLEENIDGWRALFNFWNEKRHKYENENPEFFKLLNESIYLDFAKSYHADQNIFNDLAISQNRIFVFSVSKKNDDLNQWRAYTQSPQGYCLGLDFSTEFWKRQLDIIDVNNTNPPLKGNSIVMFCKCLYSKEEKIKIIELILDSYFKLSKEKNIDNQTLHRYFIEDYGIINIFLKNENFAEESEYRLAVVLMEDDKLEFESVPGKKWPRSKRKNLINIRVGKNSFIPYLELTLHQETIKKICIGPTPLPIHSEEALKMLLSLHYKKDQPNVTRSTVPFRSW